MDRSTLDKNLRILEHPDGVVLALTDDLLFAPGQWQLRETSRPLLGMLAEVLEYVTADVAIAGHSDPAAEGGTDGGTDGGTGGGAAGYELAGRRALTVLEYFVQRKLDPARFSVAGYGPDRPSLAGQPPAPGATGSSDPSAPSGASGGPGDQPRPQPPGGNSGEDHAEARRISVAAAVRGPVGGQSARRNVHLPKERA